MTIKLIPVATNGNKYTASVDYEKKLKLNISVFRKNKNVFRGNSFIK